MILEIDNFEEFKVFFDVIYDLTELIELQVFPTHMVCSILDKSHSRFMSVEYKKEFFALYEVEDVESVTLFAEDMHKIIKSVSKIENVILETNDSYLVCRIEGQNGNFRVFEFVLPADHIESPHPPNVSLPVRLYIPIKDLKQPIKDLKIIGSNEIMFTVNGSQLNITAGIETSANYTSVIPLKEDYESHSSKFTLDYIEQLMKFEKVSSWVEFKMGQDYPLLYAFDDDIMGVKVQGLIAPRIEVE